MVDKVKALKIENPATGGTQTDAFPTETNPLMDYLAMKGISFENLDGFLSDKIGRVLSTKYPDTYESYSFTTDGDISHVEYHDNPIFTTLSRIARGDVTYNVTSLLPETEIWKIYGSDGTTILRTITFTYTFSGEVPISTKVDIV